MSVARFAPSPTGRLHAGNIRTALHNWLFARKTGGRLLLRLDDTDRERSTEEFARGIEEDLTWLGIDWAREVRQSERFDLYDAAVQTLKRAGRLYPAYETPEELELKRKRQLARGRPPVYDRAALKLTEEDKARLETGGRKPHWRFKLETRDVVWDDLVRGRQHVDAASLSDPVLVRADGTYLYTLPSVVDDIDLGIHPRDPRRRTMWSTRPRRFSCSKRSARPIPAFGHHSLLVTADGQALSKRDRSLAIEGLREDGIESLAVASYVATIGTSDPIAPHTSLDELVQSFDLSKLSRAPARFDPAELRALNAKLLHILPFSAVASRLRAMDVGGGQEFWEAVRGNLARLDEARLWWRVAEGPLQPVIEDRELCHKAAGLLPPEPWDQATWFTWSSAIKAATGAKGRALFQPLRLALTGEEQGPELKHLLPLIGRRRAAARLEGHTA
jgi:glutamyl-tRNA synthetase